MISDIQMQFISVGLTIVVIFIIFILILISEK